MRTGIISLQHVERKDDFFTFVYSLYASKPEYGRESIPKIYLLSFRKFSVVSDCRWAFLHRWLCECQTVVQFVTFFIVALDTVGQNCLKPYRWNGTNWKCLIFAKANQGGRGVSKLQNFFLLGRRVSSVVHGSLELYRQFRTAIRIASQSRCEIGFFLKESSCRLPTSLRLMWGNHQILFWKPMWFSE